jgi:hypothetical protein
MKAMCRPSPLMPASALLLSPGVRPSEAMLTRSSAPVCRSFTNTSITPFVSPAAKLDARVSKATYLPSALIPGLKLERFPCVTPSGAMLTRSTAPVCRSFTNTSAKAFVSPFTRLEAVD